MVAGIRVGKVDLVERAALRSISTAEPAEFAVDWTVRCEERVQLRKTPMF